MSLVENTVYFFVRFGHFMISSKQKHTAIFGLACGRAWRLRIIFTGEYHWNILLHQIRLAQALYEISWSHGTNLAFALDNLNLRYNIFCNSHFRLEYLFRLHIQPHFCTSTAQRYSDCPMLTRWRQDGDNYCSKIKWRGKNNYNYTLRVHFAALFLAKKC